MSPFFKNARVYSARCQLAKLTENLEDAIANDAFSPCPASSPASSGWVPVIGDSLVFSGGGNILLKWQREERMLPGHVIKEETSTRLEALETKLGRNATKAERHAIKDEATQHLLARAFTRKKQAWLWIDTNNNRVVISTSTTKQAEDITALLRRSLGSLPIVPFTLETPLSLTCKEWILSGESPNNIAIGHTLRLVGIADTDGKVTYAKCELESDEVKATLSAGRIVESLNMDWQDRASFRMDDSNGITGIVYSDLLIDQNNDIEEEDQQLRFEADAMLFFAEFKAMFSDVVASLGGEANQ